MQPSGSSPSTPTTFPELVDRIVRRQGEKVFLPRRRARIVEPVTFRRLCDDLELVAAGLLDLGIEHGDRVGLLAENRYEWLLADLGITYCGAVDVPRGSDTSPLEMAFILRHSGCKATFVEDDRAADAVLEHLDDLGELQHIITLSPTTMQPSVMTLASLMDRGRRLLRADPERLRRRAARVRPDDLLTIVYTSGTTADPKGVMLTHANVISNIGHVTTVLRISGSDTFLSVLPAWHVYERIMDYLALAAGGQLVYTDRRHIKEDLQQVAPTVFAAVPRIWETIHDGLLAYAHKKTGLGGRLLRTTLQVARAVGGRRATSWQRFMHALLRPTVLPRLLAITGGRLRLAVSGGGSLPRHIDELLLGIGLPLLNGYGLTETSPVAAVREPDHNQPGTIGPPIPETRIEARDQAGRRLGPDEIGVLWIQGPQVMRGYYQNPTKTKEVLTADGWFNSGDLGYVDADGNVWITGRQKDTIVLAGGENVEPEPIEAAIKRSTLIEQVVLVGQDQKSVGALIAPALEFLEREVPRGQWEVQAGIVQHRRVQELIRAELDRLVTRESGFRPCDRVTTFRVLAEPLTVENGCLTQTLKVRRHVVQQRYATVIAAMFR